MITTPLRDRFSIRVDEGEDIEAKGNVVNHEYKIERGGDKSPRSRSAGSGSGTLTGSRSPRARDDALILAVTVCIDQMTRD
jgi:uncharacterized protein YxjI